MFWSVRTLLPRKGRSARPGKAAQQSNRFRPALHQLEDRTVPALFIRVTAFDAANVQIGQQSFSGVTSTPFAVGHFTGTIGDTTTTTATSTSLATTWSLNYIGGPTGANSETLVVEMLGDNNTAPSTGLATISSNGSPSATPGIATSPGGIVMKAGEVNGNVGLPATAVAGGTLPGQQGTTTCTGEFVDGASSTLLPNPANSAAAFSLTTPFTLYQNYTFSKFTENTGAASMSSASTVSAVPAGVGSTATIGYWHNNNGQALIKTQGVQLGNWLASTFPNLYGPTTGANNMTGKDGNAVAAYDLTLFNGGPNGKKYNQILGVALAIYFNDPALGGAAGQAAGFAGQNTGNALYTIKASESAGAADLGLTVGQSYTIMFIMQKINGVAVNGVLPAGQLSDIAQIAADINQMFDFGGT
jgi:hypothetical protein